MQNARKGKPKYYEEEFVDWMCRNRQEGLTVTGDASKSQRSHKLSKGPIHQKMAKFFPQKE